MITKFQKIQKISNFCRFSKLKKKIIIQILENIIINYCICTILLLLSFKANNKPSLLLINFFEKFGKTCFPCRKFSSNYTV